MTSPTDPQDNWQRLMDYLVDLTWQFPQALLRIGMVVFSDDARIVTELTDTDQARFFIDETRGRFDGGLTNTAAGLRKAIELLSLPSNRPEAYDVVVVVTDGLPSINVGDVEIAARDLRGQFDAYVSVVGVTGTRDDYLFMRVTESDWDVVFVRSFEALGGRAFAAATRICSHLLNQAGGCREDVQGGACPTPAPPTPGPPTPPPGTDLTTIRNSTAHKLTFCHLQLVEEKLPRGVIHNFLYRIFFHNFWFLLDSEIVHFCCLVLAYFMQKYNQFAVLSQTNRQKRAGTTLSYHTFAPLPLCCKSKEHVQGRSMQVFSQGLLSAGQDGSSDWNANTSGAVAVAEEQLEPGSRAPEMRGLHLAAAAFTSHRSHHLQGNGDDAAFVHRTCCDVALVMNAHAVTHSVE